MFQTTNQLMMFPYVSGHCHFIGCPVAKTFEAPFWSSPGRTSAAHHELRGYLLGMS